MICVAFNLHLFFSCILLNGQMCDYQTEIVVIYNCHLQCNDNLILMLCIVCHWYHLFCCPPPPLYSLQNIFGGLCVCVCVHFKPISGNGAGILN